jgi:hypothetical protein
LETGAWYFIGLLNREMADYPNAIVQLHKAISSQQQAGMPPQEVFFAFSQLGILYLQLNQLDWSQCASLAMPFRARLKLLQI